MTIGAAMRASAGACPSCGGNVDVKSRHVAVAGASIRIYCSEACLLARDVPPVPAAQPVEPPRRRWIWWIAGGVVAGTTSLVLYALTGDAPVEPGPSALSIVEQAMQPPPPPPEPPPPPAPPDTEDADAALVGELAHDAWIHPLAGPTRRMPSIPDAAFGALRPGERPPECVSGHCGVDIGNAWGEPVHAVHDGVVDWVNRGPNDEHGGIFVKIAHRDGTLYTWYFHLAAVPHWVQPGAKVKLGQVIGLLGDTGVGSSGPHLHFSLSVKPSKTAKTERYIDPEPLIAIWPLWVANDNVATGHVTMSAAPGTPVRQDGWRPFPRKHAAPPAPAEAGSGSASTDPPPPL
jgi:hypothetical protein